MAVPDAPTVAPSQIAAAIVALSMVKVALRVGGFDRTLRLIRMSVRLPERHKRNRAPETWLRAVTAVGAFYPGRARCLEQSLTLYLLCRLSGLSVAFRLGVAPHRFSAHAWVEFDGRPIGEEEDGLRGLIALPALLT
jgi:hypothetical protein